MSALLDEITHLRVEGARDRDVIFAEVIDAVSRAGFRAVERDGARPWGGFVRLADEDADRFLHEFFPGLDPTEARLGDAAAPVSPKILVVAPHMRLSWQYHARRAERWRFLTGGAYVRAAGDEQTVAVAVESGSVVQFAAGERHRLSSPAESYVLVAEIWQHTVPGHPSDENDIVRLHDDYLRPAALPVERTNP